jgi:hypothetical protein
MGVNGTYLARQFQAFATPYFKAYADSILNDVLSGFGNLEQRADKVANAEFDRLRSRAASEDFDGDLSREAGWAQESGQAYFETMSGLRQAMINLLAAGLFHLLEQHLAHLCHDSIFRGYNLKEAKLSEIERWYKQHLDLDLTQFRQWSKINELRLIANAVKHAEGSAAKQLRKLRPDLFRHPLLVDSGLPANSQPREPLSLPLAGNDLFVTEEIFAQYASTVKEFGKDIVKHFAANGSKSYAC